MMMNLIGVLGAVFFGICALPQVMQVWNTQDTKAISRAFLILWALGEAFMWAYIIMQNASMGIIQWPLHANYFFNGICVSYLLYKKLKEPK